MMTKKERRIAEYFARLASLPFPHEALPPEEFERRQADWRASFEKDGMHDVSPTVLADLINSGGIEWTSPLRAEVEYLKKCSTRLFPGEFGEDVELGLRNLQGHVKRTFARLFAGEEVTVVPSSLGLRVEAGVLRERWISEGLSVSAQFVGTLRIVPFPFKRCAVCGRIFLRVRRQLYCSRGCTSRATEQKRRGKRREYMRKYMAVRRKRPRRSQQQQQRTER